MQHATLNQFLLDTLRSYDKPDLLWHKVAGAWQKISTHQFLTRAASLAATLKQLGLQKGDRVALFSENRPEWHIADLAVLGLGGVNLPLYAGEVPERLQFMLGEAEARLALVARREQFEKLRAVWPNLPKLEKVIAIEPVSADIPGVTGRVFSWDTVAPDNIPERLVSEFERHAQAVRPDDIASLIYTSGTTGTPKGVLLTQHNFASNVIDGCGVFGFGPADRALSVLPLCHIYGRTAEYAFLAYGTSIAYAEPLEAVSENLRQVQPTVMAVVPRFLEKLYARLMDYMRSQSALKQRFFWWALEVGRRTMPYRLRHTPLPARLAAQCVLAKSLVYEKIRAQLGGRIRLFVSGGAPLSRELNEFFNALNLTVLEGYGLTETSPVIAVNVPGAVELGTVGKPIAGIEVTIAADGEILTRGPHVMQGYYKREEETRVALAEGWFHTGDIGYLDDDGFLSITDRKRDIIKTTAGKTIAPQLIENRLKVSPYIQNALVLGDRRKYAVALLVPNFAALENFAHQQGIPASSPQAFLATAAVRRLIGTEVQKVNAGLLPFERIRRFHLLPRDFSFSEGELTYTQKVRRHIVEQRFRELIVQLYAKAPGSSGVDLPSGS